MADPAEARERLRQAALLQQWGDLAAAERVYQQVLAQAPDHADAQNLLGVLRLQQGRPEQAAHLLRAAVEGRPASPGILNNLGQALRQIGRPDEALGCFDRALAMTPHDPRLLFNRGTALSDLMRPAEALAAFDMALAAQPQDARCMIHRGIALADLGHHQLAIDSFDQALSRRPADVLALGHRGRALAALQHHADALSSYDQALSVQPDNADILCNRGIALVALQRPAEAVQTYDQALAVRPDHSEALSNRAVALYDLGLAEAALADCRRVIERQPHNAMAHWNAAACNLLLGDFAAGWRQYEWRWQTPPFAAYRRDLGVPQWRGEAAIAGRTLLLHAEQGLGDTIQFCRYALSATAAGARVTLEAQAPLVSLLRSLEPTIDVVAWGRASGPFDFHCPLLSLPLAFGTTLRTIPAPVAYLAPSPGVVEHWRQRLDADAGRGRRLRVGIAWSGSAGHRNDASRSIPLRAFADLFAAEVQFVCLQPQVRATDQAAVDDCPNLVRFDADLQDFADTAALIQGLDLVIAVDTAVAHLAGALGKPVWTLVAFAPDFRWLRDRSDTPWYPTMRLYRQTIPGNWRDVIRRVGADLAARAARAQWTAAGRSGIDMETETARM